MRALVQGEINGQSSDASVLDADSIESRFKKKPALRLTLIVHVRTVGFGENKIGAEAHMVGHSCG
jgi:hypothetical protein